MKHNPDLTLTSSCFNETKKFDSLRIQHKNTNNKKQHKTKKNTKIFFFVFNHIAMKEN